MPEENHRESSGGVIRFGEYDLDPKRGVLSRGGIPLKIQPQPLRVLELLLMRSPGVVTREELSDYVWGNGVNVDLDQSLNFCVRQIRSVLNDSASNPKFIDTLPKQGYRFVGDVVRETAPVSAAGAGSIAGEPKPLHGTVPDAPARVTRRTFAWSAAAAAAVVGGGAWLARSHRRTSSPKAVTVVIPLPEGATTADPLRVIGPAAVAPDGSTIAFPLKSADTTDLYLRHLDSNRLIRLEGGETASSLFWSPDSQHIAFAADGDKIKRMPAVGGSPVVLCNNAVDARGGTWSRSGDILFGTAYGPVFHVSASGGKGTRVTQVDEAAGESSHWFPLFLPDGNRFLYYVMADDREKRGVYLESLDHRQSKRRLVVADNFSYAIALDPEKNIYYLLSEQAGKIAAQIFDVDHGELSGPSRILLDRPGMLSVSETGTLVIRKFGQDTSPLVWRDRTGRELGVLGTPDDFEGVHLSPDDRFAAITRQEPMNGNTRIWIASLPDGLLEPLSDSNHAVNPMWSEDSRTVYYNDERRGLLLRRSVSPRGPEEVVMETGVARRTHVDGISPDGRYAVAELVANWAHAETVWTEMKGGSKGGPQWRSIDAPGREGMLPSFSADGRWLAFSSNPTGRSEIYVMDFPGGSQRLRVSTSGGAKPRWRRDGKELFYVAADGSMMAAKITIVGGQLTAESQRLFDANLKIHTNYDANYAVSSDGQRFLGIAREAPSGDVDIQMVLNWPSLLA
jgi:Tol biopolymer transport system component/DNA-binding winged helix-turn-helix (wHTH) protein